MAKLSVKHWQDPVNLILGLWLIASPWILMFRSETYAMWSAVGLGSREPRSPRCSGPELGKSGQT